MTRAVQRNTPRIGELAVACALSADGPQVLPVAVPQNLDAMVAAVAHDNVDLVVQRQTLRFAALPVA